jgi:hypothetical protein
LTSNEVGGASDSGVAVVERSDQRLARQGRPDFAQGLGGGGAHARLGIPQRADQRRDRADLVQPPQDQRRLDPHLE